MIKVGINENVYLEKVTFDEKNALELTFQEVGKVKEKPTSFFDNLAGDDVQEGRSGMSIKLFPVLVSKKEEFTEQKKRELVVADINRIKAVLRHILLAYLPSTELIGLWNGFIEGLPVTPVQEDFDQKILQKEILEGIHKNMGRAFIEKITPFLNKPDLKFRLLLVRTSKDKHYATFRSSYVDDNPFYETMDISAEMSKVKFTPYELSNGLNSDTPVAKDAAADKKAGGTGGDAPKTVENVFG